MFSKRLIRGGALVAVACAAVIVSPGSPLAQPTTVVARLTATTVGLKPGAGETVKFDVLRWLTDEEAQKLLTAFKEKGEKQLAADLQTAPTVGYIWTSGAALGYSIRYARRFDLPDGGERIVLATDRTLGSWNREPWKSTAAGALAVEYPFSVIELRVNRRGDGEGKATLAAKVAVDPAGNSLALENYAAAPVLLKSVQRISTATASR